MPASRHLVLSAALGLGAACSGGASPPTGGAQAGPSAVARGDAPAAVPATQLCDVAVLDAVDPAAVTLTPGSFMSWPDAFAAHPDALDFLVTPGDYVAWGPLELTGQQGRPDRRRTVRYHDPDGSGPVVNPVRRKREARIDSLSAMSGASDWVVAGLTIRAPSKNNRIGDGAARITLDSMLIEEAPIYGLRILSSADVCVQRSVIRRAPRRAGQDSVGIQIKPGDAPVTGVRLLDNEIYDCGDGMGITASSDDPWRAVDVQMIGNDLYTTPAYAGCTENGIDLKGGSDEVQSLVVGNRIWGYVGTDRDCAGSGSRGDGIVVHRAARNILIERNQIGNGAFGIIEKHWPPEWEQDRSRRVVIRDNYIHDVQAAFKLAHDTEVIDNTIVRAATVCDSGPKAGYRRGGPVFRGNVRIATGKIPSGDRHPCPYDERANREAAPSKTPIAVRRGRWTEGRDAAAPAAPVVAAPLDR